MSLGRSIRKAVGGATSRVAKIASKAFGGAVKVVSGGTSSIIHATENTMKSIASNPIKVITLAATPANAALAAANDSKLARGVVTGYKYVLDKPAELLKVANPITMVAAVAPKSISDKINILTPAGVPNIQDKRLKKTAMIGYGTAIAVAGGVALAAYGGTAAITGAAGKVGTVAGLVKGAFPGANANTDNTEGQDFQNAAYSPDGTAVAGPAPGQQMILYIGIGIVLLLILRK